MTFYHPEDESLSSEITSSNENQSGTEDEDALIIPPSPKRRKNNNFDRKNNDNTPSTSTKHVNQHVKQTSGINQSHISELSVQPTFNTLNADNTSPLQCTVQPDSTHEHDKLHSFSDSSQPEPVFFIPLDKEPAPLTPESQIQSPPAVQIQDHQLDSEDTTTIENPIVPLQNSTPNSPLHPSNQQIPNDVHDNIDNPFDDDYYIIEHHPSSPPPESNNLHGSQIINCEGDEEVQEDVENGWTRITNDLPPNHPPFTDTPGLNLDTNARDPEIFFNQLFDERMFTIIAEETNNYAHQQISKIMGGRDEIEQIEHYSHKWYARLGRWRDANKADIKIFIAHLLIISSVKKPALHNYWTTNSLSRTPFFGTYLSRNQFQDILWNLHVADTTNNPPPGMPDHDPLAKVYPLVTMCQNNFRLRYTPSKFLAIDESTLAFKAKYTFFLKKINVKLQI